MPKINDADRSRLGLVEKTEHAMLGHPPKVKGALLVKAGYYQTSRAHRMLSRLPKGTNAKDALYDARMAEYKKSFLNDDGTPKNKKAGEHYQHWVKEIREWVNALGERSCLGHYLWCYAEHIVVDEETFRAFRKAGGEAA